MSLDPLNRAAVTKRLLELSQEFRGQPDGLVDTYKAHKESDLARRRARAKALLRAPMRDPNDETRKYTTDDREAWVDLQEDVIAAEDAELGAEVAHKYHAEAVWARKNELEALRTMAADAREELKYG